MLGLGVSLCCQSSGLALSGRLQYLLSVPLLSVPLLSVPLLLVVSLPSQYQGSIVPRSAILFLFGFLLCLVYDGGVCVFRCFRLCSS